MSLINFTKVIGNLAGRDKVNKSVQFGAKLVFYILSEIQTAPEIAAKCKQLSAGIGNARKVDRLLKWTVEIQKAIDALNESKGDDFPKYLTILSAGCHAMYWWCDNKIFFSRIKALDNINVKEMSITGHSYWLIGLLILMYLLAIKMAKLYRQREELEQIQQSDKKEMNKINNQIFLKRLQLFGYFCDVMVALNNSGYMEMIKGSKLNDGQYGLAGFISACTVLYRIWPSNQ